MPLYHKRQLLLTCFFFFFWPAITSTSCAGTEVLACHITERIVETIDGLASFLAYCVPCVPWAVYNLSIVKDRLSSILTCMGFFVSWPGAHNKICKPHTHKSALWPVREGYGWKQPPLRVPWRKPGCDNRCFADMRTRWAWMGKSLLMDTLAACR